MAQRNVSVISVSSTPVVTIFVRHSVECPHQANKFHKGCRCRKSLRFFHNGKQQTQSAQTRSWSQAEIVKREIEGRFGGATPSSPIEAVSVKPETRMTIARATELFVSDKISQGIDLTAQGKHQRELGRFSDFMSKRSKLFPDEISLEDLTEFRAGWKDLYPSSLTRSKVQERLRGFLRYCHNAKLINHLPQLSAIRIIEPPTLPLTEYQYARLLNVIPTEFRSPERVTKMLALVELMRHTGLAIQDAVTLKRTEVKRDSSKGIFKVVTSRQKTGVHVAVPIQPTIAEGILAAMKFNRHPDYIFWNRKDGKPKAAVDVWERAFKRAFNAAGMTDGHSHQLRDTFAVGLLQNGVPIEEVSKALGHTSVKTTEKSYAPWVTARQDRLDSLVMGTWQSL